MVRVLLRAVAHVQTNVTVERHVLGMTARRNVYVLILVCCQIDGETDELVRRAVQFALRVRTADHDNRFVRLLIGEEEGHSVSKEVLSLVRYRCSWRQPDR